MNPFRSLNLAAVAAAAALAGVPAASSASVVLAGGAPADTGTLNGISVYDGGGGPYGQSLAIAAGATLEAIVWWGYRGAGDPDPDAFEVALDGNAKTGTLSTDGDGLLTRYTLDIADEFIGAGGATLTLFNNVNTFEWFWQCAVAAPCDSAGNPAVAFNLIGTERSTKPLPLPGTLALAALGLLAVRPPRRRA